ncbi:MULTISPECIES: hypothetical protein [Helicobacter]|nr:MULTISPECIES: hypothetical protein [Helicobacter]
MVLRIKTCLRILNEILSRFQTYLCSQWDIVANALVWRLLDSKISIYKIH